MKAVLVVDMPDDMRIEDTEPLNVTLYNGLFVREVKMNRPLKPLPTKFKTYKLSPRDQEETELFINMAMIKVYADGYNACLKEIE